MTRTHYPECPGCGGIITDTDYLCPSCMKSSAHTPPALLLDEPRVTREDRSIHGCETCPFLETCKERLAGELWVMCEIPDELDMFVARRRYGDAADPMM